MRPRCSVFIATSLDGFIARADGSLDWLDTANRLVPAGEDCGYGGFIASIDTIVMGRHTFEKALGFSDWPYRTLKVVVLSRHALAVPKALAATVSVASEQPRHLVHRLGAAGAKSLYVDGGETIRGFLRAGLIDELTVTVVPILLGAGRPLFGSLNHPIDLELVDSKRFDFGFLQYRYRTRESASTPQGRDRVSSTAPPPS